MEKVIEDGWNKFCEAQGIKHDGQFADDVRPAFDAGFACGNAIGNEPIDAVVAREQLRKRMIALYNLPDDATWFDVAGASEHGLQALRLAQAVMTQFCDRVDKGEVRSVRTYKQFKGLLASDAVQLMATPGRVSVDAEALRRVLTALVSAPHLIREFQATREPVELFADNPINVLLRNYQERQL